MRNGMEIPLVLFLLIALIIVVLCGSMVGCGTGPKIPLCIWSSDRTEFDCVDRNGKAYICKGADQACNKMIGTTKDGLQQLLDYYKQNCGQ